MGEGCRVGGMGWTGWGCGGLWWGAWGCMGGGCLGHVCDEWKNSVVGGLQVERWIETDIEAFPRQL